MSSTREKARIAGLFYLGILITGPFSLLYVPSVVIVPGDAAATARKIIDAAFLYRAGILGALLSSVFFLLLVWSLYNLFEEVDKKLARLMVMLVSVAVAVDVVLLVYKVAPLVLLSGADFLSVFPKPQLEALAYAFLRLRSNGLDVLTAFWGLWLFPFGVLVFKSGFLPRILAILLLVAGFALLTLSFTCIVFPAYKDVIGRVAWPLDGIGELPIAFWLLVKGAKAPRDSTAITGL